MEDIKSFSTEPSLSVYIENAGNENLGGFTMPLPTTSDALRPFLDGIEITDWRDIRIWEAMSSIAYVASVVTEACQKTPSQNSLSELNYLAALLDGMTEEQRSIFSAMTQTELHVDTMADVINAALSVDAYELQPAFTAEQFGEHLMIVTKDETTYAFHRLKESESEEDKSLAEHIERLEAVVDHAAYGRRYAAEEQGVFTDAGYITKIGEHSESYRGAGDIPAEYKITPLAQESFMKLENVDLTALLTKMHALGGEYMPYLSHNVNTLEQCQSFDYLLLMTERSLYLTEMANAYRIGTPAHDAFMNTAALGTHAFALHVTNTYPESSVGDLVGLSLGSLKANIMLHSVSADRIDAVQKFGPDVSLTPEQWEKTNAMDRSVLQSWEPHYNPADVGALDSYLESVSDAYASGGATVSQDSFLIWLGIRCMDQSLFSQPDMLRVPSSVAKELLAEGTNVYQITAGGSKLLTPLEAVRGKLLDRADAITAINKSDLASLDRWAERTVKSVLRTQERGDRGKSHNNEL